MTKLTLCSREARAEILDYKNSEHRKLALLEDARIWMAGGIPSCDTGGIPMRQVITPAHIPAVPHVGPQLQPPQDARTAPLHYKGVALDIDHLMALLSVGVPIQSVMSPLHSDVVVDNQVVSSVPL